MFCSRFPLEKKRFPLLNDPEQNPFARSCVTKIPPLVAVLSGAPRQLGKVSHSATRGKHQTNHTRAFAAYKFQFHTTSAELHTRYQTCHWADIQLSDCYFYFTADWICSQGYLAVIAEINEDDLFSQNACLLTVCVSKFRSETRASYMRLKLGFQHVPSGGPRMHCSSCRAAWVACRSLPRVPGLRSGMGMFKFSDAGWVEGWVRDSVNCKVGPDEKWNTSQSCESPGATTEPGPPHISQRSRSQRPRCCLLPYMAVCAAHCCTQTHRPVMIYCFAASGINSNPRARQLQGVLWRKIPTNTLPSERRQIAWHKDLVCLVMFHRNRNSFNDLTGSWCLGYSLSQS